MQNLKNILTWQRKANRMHLCTRIITHNWSLTIDRFSMTALHCIQLLFIKLLTWQLVTLIATGDTDDVNYSCVSIPDPFCPRLHYTKQGPELLKIIHVNDPWDCLSHGHTSRCDSREIALKSVTYISDTQVYKKFVNNLWNCMLTPTIHCRYAGSLFNKRTDVLPQDLAKTRKPQDSGLNFQIALTFDRYLDSSAAEMPVKF